MRFSEYFSLIRPALSSEKARASVPGIVSGEDVSLPYTHNGWVNIADGQYTPESPLVVLQDARTQITADGLGATTNTAFSGSLHADIWSEDRMRPTEIGEAYLVRLTCTITQTTSGTGNFVIFEADIGTDAEPFIAASQSLVLVKGQDVPTLVTVSGQFFCLDTFGRNGARFFLTPSTDVSIYNVALFFQRTFRP